MTEINLDLETLYTELRQNISFIVLSNGYLMQKPVMIYKSEVEKLGGVMNAHVIYNTLYEDYGNYKPDNITMRNIKDRHDSWMWKLFPKEDREPNIHQYSPTLVLAPQPNFGLEIREYLDLLFDNCIDFKLFQCYMSQDLPEHITTRGKYVMHLVGQHIVIEYDRPTNFLSHTKHDYIASTLIRDEPLF